MKLREEIGDKQEIAQSYNSIGIIHDDKGNYDKAIRFYYKALRIFKEIGDKQGMAAIYNNIGNIYHSKGNYAQTIEFYSKALKIEEEIGNKRGMAESCNNIGNIYVNGYKGNYDKAIEFYSKALKIQEEIGDKHGLVNSYLSIGTLYIHLKKFIQASKYLNKGLGLSKSIGTKTQTKEAYLELSNLDTTLNNWKSAYHHYKLYKLYHDSIFTKESEEKISSMQAQYESEKKEQEIKLLKLEREKKDAITKEQQRKQKIIIYSISAGLLIVIIFLGYVTYSLNVNKKQKNIIAAQKQLVEEKNQEIVDSINYAKRIQNTILPNEHKWDRLLPDSFILYLPKDIVAGDFYWLEETDEYIYVAAADSTGHGVPGAMVSVICSSALTKAVLEDKKVTTNEILDRVREIVLEKLTREGEHIRDGMDICLVRINKKNQTELQFSGANRPLWIMNENKELQTYEGDKQPIGLYEYAQPFIAQNIPIHQGSTVYLFTDGYADQFGGEKQKKIGNKQFREMIKNIREISMDGQLQALEKFFNDWKKNNYQVDDITVIGMKV